MKEGREGKRVEVRERERKKEAEPDRLRLEAMRERKRGKNRDAGERSNWKTRSRTGLSKIETDYLWSRNLLICKSLAMSEWELDWDVH